MQYPGFGKPGRFRDGVECRVVEPMHPYEMESLVEDLLSFGYPLVIVMVLFRGRPLPSPFDSMPV